MKNVFSSYAEPDQTHRDLSAREQVWNTRRLFGPLLPIKYVGTFLLLLMAGAGACSDETTDPELSLVGTWDLIGFTDGGVAATATGIGNFRSDGTFSIEGTITFPNEPTDPIAMDGTYRQSGDTVELTIGAETTNWTLAFMGDVVTLTEVEPAPANTITLRRQ